MRWCAFVLFALAVVGCGDSAAATSTPVSNVPATGDCAGIPTIPRDNPPDSLELTRDPALEAKFPAVVDQQPVRDLASARWIETLCVLGGQTSVDAARLNVSGGLELDDMTVGSAQAAVDGLGVTITAFRLPGHQGDELIPVIGVLSSALTASAPKFTSELDQMTVGGKSVQRWTNAADGSSSYLYSSGDTLFVIEGVTPSQADKVFAALG